MLYRFSSTYNALPDDSNSTIDSLDGQRSRPRTGPIEKIADIAYDTLRKHEGAWQSDEHPEQSRDTPEESR